MTDTSPELRNTDPANDGAMLKFTSMPEGAGKMIGQQLAELHARGVTPEAALLQVGRQHADGETGDPGRMPEDALELPPDRYLAD